MERGFHFIERGIVLEVEGLHAPRYLHNRLSNDIKAMSVGNVRLAAALTPTGKVEGLFTVYKAAEQRFILTCSGGERESVIAALKRYIVADRMTVKDLTEELMLAHVVGEASPIQSLAWEGIVVAAQRIEKSGFDFLVPRAKRDEVFGFFSGLKIPELSENEYLLSRIRAQKPQFPDEINDRNLLPETGPMEAVAFGKGCYVGQEVMEKVDAYGRTGRRLVRIQFKGRVEAPDSMDVVDALEKNVIGKILSSAFDSSSEETEALAIVRNSIVLDKGKVCVIGSNAEGAVLS